jgi:hypothetical protein
MAEFKRKLNDPRRRVHSPQRDLIEGVRGLLKGATASIAGDGAETVGRHRRPDAFPSPLASWHDRGATGRLPTAGIEQANQQIVFPRFSITLLFEAGFQSSYYALNLRARAYCGEGDPALSPRRDKNGSDFCQRIFSLQLPSTTKIETVVIAATNH